MGVNMASHMPMKYEEKALLSRADIANRLRQLADQVARGNVAYGDVQTTMPEQAAYEFEVDIHGRTKEISIEIEWR